MPYVSRSRPRRSGRLGDSISDVQYFNDEAYPYWLARYLAPAQVMADGVAGNGVVEILDRCQPDGIRTSWHVHKPGSIAFVLAGVNDIMFRHFSPSRITAGLTRIYRYLASHGSTVDPVTILPCAKAPTMSDGANPPALRSAFDNGDGVHPWHIVGPQTLALTCALALVQR
jgi:hypothetical protein